LSETIHLSTFMILFSIQRTSALNKQRKFCVPVVGQRTF